MWLALPTLLCCRFVHELFRSQAAGKEKREQLAAALECVRGAEGRRDWLEERLGREKEVLLEKAEVSRHCRYHFHQMSSHGGRLGVEHDPDVTMLQLLISTCIPIPLFSWLDDMWLLKYSSSKNISPFTNYGTTLSI